MDERGRGRRDRGTVLMLMPAAVLVLLILGAIAFDYAHLYLGKQELVTVVEGAANDAATNGADQAAIRRGEAFRLDADLVVASVQQSLAVHAPDLHLVGDPIVELLSPTEVRVTVTATIDYVFAPVVPGVARSATVTASATADAISG
jgi:Flp pilus assembly protein TadG